MAKILRVWIFIFFPGILLAKSGFLLRSHRFTSANTNDAEDSHPPISVVNAKRQKARVDDVRKALQHLWTGYRKVAWGADEVKPISGVGRHDVWGGVGMLILDTLDTLWLAGLKEEFEEGEEWVSELQFEPLNRPTRTSFFEVTIRGLAGLLSAYALSGHPVFLDKAKLLGDQLLQGFPQPGSSHRWPVYSIDVHHPIDQEVTPTFRDASLLAEVGSNVLEFGYLSQATGDPQYQLAADDVFKKLAELSRSGQQALVPVELNPYSADFLTDRISVGAAGDSFYEYLLKNYIQTGCKNQELLSTWKSAMQSMKRSLLTKSPQGFTFIQAQSERFILDIPAETLGEMEHLSCYVGGMLASASHYVPASEVEEWWLPTAIEITRTCYEMYRLSPLGLAPDSVVFDEEGMHAAQADYRLRPETLESLFFLHRITGNSTYREWSWKIFQAIRNKTETKYGFATVSDVKNPAPHLEDSEETFMGAETLKYALLTQMPWEAISLNKFVFNTEAHPFPAGHEC